MGSSELQIVTSGESLFPPDEWAVRTDLAALYRLVAHFRMTDMIDTHISARLPTKPGEAPAFLINRYGLLFDEMRASDLVKIDHAGNVIDERAKADPARFRVNAAGFTIHSAIHMARHDLRFVVHTHTAAGIAVSAQARGLLPISQHALKFYGKLGYHDYEGIALDLSERERLVRDFGPHKAMILRNHGLIAGGASAAEAFHEIYFLERACQAQVQATSGGAELIIPPAEVRERTARQFLRDDSAEITETAWHAALRLIDDPDSDYRT
ncbi:class II aldolase/adducin family protein [Caballeronia ptereochthonis]|uniref:Aldolase II superfamily protein n=1 Tax=Caballeronia ptereochthonis TaxID=1777144 RepID=A0A158E9F2_9BURK|nr:class II aldolase/adducin family protein [Caballeronia ptereochthonis]SAL03478.1 aldolase II superfamily protein [Caballeronia ptereochthonis]